MKKRNSSKANKTNRGINICLSSDANYEPHLWVTLFSLIKSAKSARDYHIHILDGGIENKDYFYDLIASDKRFTIEFIDMSNQYTNAFESRHVSKAAYYRLAIFQIFKSLHRVIYIDADSYVLSDIADLYDIKMGDKLVAGVRDSITYERPWREKYISYKNYSGKALSYFEKYLQLSSNKLEHYFSSGVLVFNLSQMDITQKLKELESIMKGDYYCHDQDILNLLFDESETYLIGREWNYFNSGPLLLESDFVLEEERENYLRGLKPKVVSYVLKPWFSEFRNSPYAKEYWEILKLSPYYKEVLEKMEKNTKFARFLRLSLVDKIKFLTTRNALDKYINIVKNLFKKRS